MIVIHAYLINIFSFYTILAIELKMYTCVTELNRATKSQSGRG